MTTSATSQGQLQRPGVQRLISDRKGKKRKRMLASRSIRESLGYRTAFQEEGENEKSKNGKKNRVYLVTIIEEGLGNSKDKNFYSAEALKSGVKVFEGAKAYADHPDAITEKTLPERSMKDLVGWYSNCFTDKNPQSGKVRLRGKLHFFPSAKWLTDMIDTILTDSSAKNLFGISINAVGKTREATMGGEQVNYVEQFQRVDSADVVTEPAARGKFDQMLESRRKVIRNMGKTKRAREAATMSPEKLKEVADSLVSAYNSDNPDEMKEAAYQAAKVLHAASSISGTGPGQSNEEQYSNINPSGGKESMSKKKVKASTGGKHSFRKGKRRLQAASGTGEDNQNIDEPDESDIDPRLEESDVEDEEERGDLGDQKDHGDGRYHKVKASREALEDEGLEEDEGFEDEGMEDEGFEDEGLEDEGMEDEDGVMAPAAGGGAMPAAGGGAPGSSRTVASAEADDDDDDDGDDDDDMDDMDESFEDEHDMTRPGVVAESGNRRRNGNRRMRSREADDSGQGAPIRKASYAGGLGHSGHSSLPKGGDPTRGYEDSDEDFGKKDNSTLGVGKSYKIKTSRFARNRRQRRFAKPIVREANRRIEFLTREVSRLRESLRHKQGKIETYVGKLRFIESEKSARRLLREAVDKEILPENAPKVLYPILLGLNEKQQIRKIRESAYFLESATEGAVSRLTESVEGNGARGGFAFRESAGQNSALLDGLANSGVPMKDEEE